ncbi:eukaryotic translation initiation factor 4E-binding protein Mextli isoform X1 [Bombus pyrosoma]|uniref:eukaryotic translation initiation factor 4E-binding protein Mextli isoform X1 n=1 Tax=Bombus pyrosoma TaxID=396416 RepID=UPI001CB97D66|nr:eukaryotic translation initiation factor 4E-binding protein Mextli isoform X1 [Bombus pyrosoma]XP_043594910.1 eukaryotic translation initiation factor 4E-binding protein Mextli isoform X1 [Bombus pyrosoma]XP_043594911.1 eukaryotic translation initiation factor 4E-binding protein Mextli isoform X1 [Bombus pyrosoma]XP_043594912.1 eukaryotic translation initiation factor 4E-binding protein Mextli isoform X1 [Bombus pyrosoma]
MAATQLNRARTIKKIEKPRPLKLAQRHATVDGRITTVEDIVSLIDNVAMQLTNGFHDRTLQISVITMCNHLKLCAPQLEAIYKDQLDRAFVAIRNGSQDEKLDLTTRVHLLELIELRAKQWRHTDSMDVYYTQKLSHLDNAEAIPDTPTNVLSSPMATMTSPTVAPILGPGEVIKNSGKFVKPTRIPGKNYCKDEVVIRNSDSGKVMGIKGRRVHMIEELSQTIISFQRVNPGAKERLVQITGTSEDKIHYAKDLIKDTIQRNASPVRLEQGGGEKGAMGGSSSSLNSSASDESNRLQHQQQNSRLRSSLLHSFSTNDASIGEYKYTVTVGNQSLKITGCNLDLVRTAKLVLDEYFLGDSENFTSGIEYFNFEEESPFSISSSSTQKTLLTPNNTNEVGRELNMDSTATSESEETYKPFIIPEPSSSTQGVPEIRELTYEFLLLCSTGPYAKRPPADWARIQKECPNIVRKEPIRWFEPETYKAKVAAAGLVTVLTIGEGETDPE